MHCTYTLHAPYIHCTKLLISEFYKRTIDTTKYFYLKLYKLVQYMYGVYMVLCRVHVGCMYGKKRALFGATLVHVWCRYGAFMTKIILKKNNKPVHLPNSNGSGLVQ